MARKITESLHAGRSPRVALFTPLPPAETGTADYAAGLITELEKLVALEVFERPPLRFRPDAYQALIYQMGNNPYHAEIYRTALKYPGIVVLHEANLHDLIRGLTANDGAAYFREVAFEIFGREVEELPRGSLIEPGPQSRAFTMLRRLLSRSKGCIVHSQCVADEARRGGFGGKIGVIPHGVKIQRLDGAPYRERLGIGPDQPVLGLFGYQRPDKLACDCLLVFRDILRHYPDARLLIAGKPHPEVSIAENIAALGLEEQTHVLGFQTLVDLDGFIAACDVVLNLRHPTLGETSGTMMRAFALGKTVVVSKNGANCDLPDHICPRIPADEFQGRMLEECLLWLLSDHRITSSIGEAARQWAEDACSWDRVARCYARFALSAGDGEHARGPCSGSYDAEFLRSYVLRWVAPGSPARGYLATNLTRLVKTLEMIPRASDDASILEMGCYLQITPALRNLLGYAEVRGCYQGSGGWELRTVEAEDGEQFECEIDLFNAEGDPFPYPSNRFDTVLCCELLEHLTEDPMGMMCEIHRVLKPGGTIVLTTPNAASLHAVYSVMHGNHPAFYCRYPHLPNPTPEARLSRHVREYTTGEIASLLCDSGFILMRMDTGEYDERFPEFNATRELLMKWGLSGELRGKCTFAVAKKAANPKNRYPSWLYDE